MKTMTPALRGWITLVVGSALLGGVAAAPQVTYAAHHHKPHGWHQGLKRGWQGEGVPPGLRQPRYIASTLRKRNEQARKLQTQQLHQQFRSDLQALHNQRRATNEQYKVQERALKQREHQATDALKDQFHGQERMEHQGAKPGKHGPH